MVDVNLIISCQRRDKDAFGVLYKTYITKALRTVYLLVNRRDIAEDIIQEAFFECYRDIEKLHNPEFFETWFYRILVRVSWRMAARERKNACEDLDECAEYLEDKQTNFATVEAYQDNTLLREAISSLNTPLRTTIILFYYNDMSIKEIAQVMNCLQGTVKSRLYYGRKLLAKKFMNQHNTFSEALMNKGI